MARPVQPHIPGLARSDKKPKTVRRSEKVLQAQTRQVLAALNYASMETGAGRSKVKCKNCGHSDYPEGWQGNTVGLPDLLFFRYAAGFPPVMIPVELKGEGTEIRKEQKALSDGGRSVIAHSERQALVAVLEAELAMDAYRLDPERKERILRFLSENAGKLGECAEPET
jgi:hypothetical protein